MLYAHSRNEQGQRHELSDHLQSVATLTGRFARPLGAADAGYYLGLWHDLGKLHHGFQRYLLKTEAGEHRPGRSPDHKSAGAYLAAKHLGPLAMILQGHHGGLTSLSHVKAWLATQKDVVASVLCEAGRLRVPIRPEEEIPLPDHILHDRLAAELFMRLLFSALVDADYLDTEAHFEATAAEQRGSKAGLDELWERFERDQARLSGHRRDPVNEARHAIYQACLQASTEPPGLCRLTVPTGGGKTRSAMGFALRHALAHGMERVIVAIPFISITEQTAATLRQIFERDGEPPVVLEHHSAVKFPENEADASKGAWTRLAAENWDAPIIVTTTVRLFESLFANKPQAMRKLHRLANAIIILDEAQSLPPQRLEPILDALRQLATHYNSTVVFSTATQPAFDAIPAFHQLEMRELVPSPERFYRALERVEYHWQLKEPLSWQDISDVMMETHQALAVVNTKRDALNLFQCVAYGDPAALHLSAGMCGLHRTKVLNEVKRRLQEGEPCHLVSTQVVEAGVDIDFPLVFRAVGPLDAIIQAAGRCNREGRLDRGRVIVFSPQEGGLPPGVYATATGLARAILGRGNLDPNSSQAANTYFARLYDTIDLDVDDVQGCRERLDFRETARRFHMIDRDTISVVVRFGSSEKVEQLERTFDYLQNQRGNPRLLLRSLQPYLVSLYRHRAERARSQGLLTEIIPGLDLWLGAYDPRCGLLFEDAPPESFII